MVMGGGWVPQDLREVSSSVSRKRVPPTPSSRGLCGLSVPDTEPKPPVPSPPPPSALNCWLWIVVSDESIHFFGVLRGFLPHNLSVEFESAFFEQGFNRPSCQTATVGLVCYHSRNAERRLVVRPRLLLFISLSAPEACLKDDHQLVLHLPRIKWRRAVRRNANDRNGHLPKQKRNVHTH